MSKKQKDLIKVILNDQFTYSDKLIEKVLDLTEIFHIAYAVIILQYMKDNNLSIYDDIIKNKEILYETITKINEQINKNRE